MLEKTELDRIGLTQSSLVMSAKQTELSLSFSFYSSSSLPSCGPDHEHGWPSALPETHRSLAAWASTQQPPAVHLNRKHRPPRRSQPGEETKHSWYASERRQQKEKKMKTGETEVMEVREGEICGKRDQLKSISVESDCQLTPRKVFWGSLDSSGHVLEIFTVEGSVKRK